jgi:hypothetical protein
VLYEQALARREEDLGFARSAAADQGVAAENAAQGLAHRIAALVAAERESMHLQVRLR